jgi:hypothetical protein
LPVILNEEGGLAMTQEELHDAARRQPFIPFRVILTTGAAHDIRHPDLIMVGRRLAVIGLANDATSSVFDRTLIVDLLHVVGIEMPPAASASSNGPA